MLPPPQWCWPVLHPKWSFFQSVFLQSFECQYEVLIQVKSRIYPNIVVIQSTAIFQSLPVNEKTLLIRWDSFCVLNFCFHIHNSVCRFHFQSDHLSSPCFYKDLHASTKYDNQVESRFIRNIVVTQKTAIFHFLPVEDKTLLIWRDFLFVLNFLFYFLCGV